MAGEYDFMLPEDRAQKMAEFESERLAWISTRSRGITRFVLLHELTRTVVLVVGWSVFQVVFRHASIPQALQVTIFVLLLQVIFNLLQWHRNERRYNEKSFVTRARL